jgi:GDPmannose 4,6-dehydratase
VWPTAADDYVIATGVDHSVRDFVATAFESAGMTDWEAHVAIDPDLFRPSDPAVLVGDATHARKVLDWRPTRTFESVIEEMVRADVEQVKPSAS